MQSSNPDYEWHSFMSNYFETRQLIAFTTLAKTGSFTRTAETLYLTQSAISHSVKALETDLNCKLFTRIGKKIQLTLAGEQLFVEAEQILGAMSKARNQIENTTEWGKGRLRVGASTTLCQYILPNVLREFNQSFPQCKIIIEPGNTPEQTENLKNHTTDIALTLEPTTQAKDYSFKPLFTDELTFLLSPQHSWATRGKVNRKTMRDQQYLLYSKSSHTFKIISKYFKEQNFDLENTMEPGSVEAIKELVKIGMGVGIAAPWIAQKEIEEGSLIVLPIGRKKLERQWGFTYLKNKRLSLAEETFLGLCEGVSQNLTLKYKGFKAATHDSSLQTISA